MPATQPSPGPAPLAPPEPLDTPPWPRGAWLGLVVSLIATALVAALIGLGRLPALALAAGFGAALLGWWRTTFGARVDARRAVVPIVGLTVLLMLLTTEAWWLDLPGFLAARVPWSAPEGTDFSERALLIAAYLLFAACVFGAWAAWYRHPLGEYAAWLAAAFPVALAAGLLALSAATGAYAPGLLTSLVGAGAGVAAARALVAEARSADVR